MAAYSVFWAERITVRKRMGCSPYFAATGTHLLILSIYVKRRTFSHPLIRCSRQPISSPDVRSPYRNAPKISIYSIRLYSRLDSVWRRSSNVNTRPRSRISTSNAVL
jgi:hypothetical protein